MTAAATQAARPFHAFLEAPARAPEIPESADLYGFLLGSWELDVKRYWVDVSARGLKGDDAKVVKDALKEVEEQEDEHLYHSTGWCRELWIESLGLPAVLPPPEEEKDVKTAIGAARAKKARREML